MENGLQKALEQQWSSPVFDPNAYLNPVGTWMQVHRIWESIAAKHYKEATQDSYETTLKKIEEADKVLNQKIQQTKEQGLVFPFDMMQLASDNLVASWNAVTGQHDDSSLSEQYVELEDALAKKAVECEKALKAKQTAQRNLRKTKTELDASDEKVKALNEELRSAKTALETEKKAVQQQQAGWQAEKKELIAQNELLKKQLAELQKKQAAATKMSDAS